MRKFGLLLLASLLAAPLILSSPARAQQYAVTSNCSLGVDGGTTTSTLTCPVVATNYQPTTLNCEIATAGSHLVGSTTLQLSGDGTHFAPVQDGGLTIFFNQDVNTTTSLSVALSPTNPYQSSQVVTSITINDGGTAGGATVNCQTSVVQTQTLHSPHIIRAAKEPAAPKVTK